MTNLQRLLKISRPKFWHYLAGPFLLASIPVLKNDLSQFPLLLAGLIWLLIFGNFFVYGINDLNDHDTDILNEKKNGKDEILLQETETKKIKLGLILAFVSGTFFLFTSQLSAISWLFFLFFSWQYSAYPIRAKSKPFIDGIFNILYLLPAQIAFGIQGEILPLYIIIAGTLWCMAMHAFSAIPDIEPDKNAALKTTATLLGWRNTLIYCFTCYTIIFFILPDKLLQILLIPYLIIVAILFFKKEKTVVKFYPYFPLLNVVIGILLFFYIFLKV